MPGQVVRQPRPFQLPFPILRGDVRVRDLTVQRVRVLPGNPVHVLRPRTGEFVDPAQVRPRVGEDGSDYPSESRRLKRLQTNYLHRGTTLGISNDEFMRTTEERHAAIEAAAQHVFEMKRLLEKAAIPCPIVTGAGSGTYMLEAEAGAWDEIQVGSYIFMDADYARNEWAAPLPRLASRIMPSAISASSRRSTIQEGPTGT